MQTGFSYYFAFEQRWPRNKVRNWKGEHFSRPLSCALISCDILLRRERTSSIRIGWYRRRSCNGIRLKSSRFQKASTSTEYWNTPYLVMAVYLYIFTERCDTSTTTYPPVRFQSQLGFQVFSPVLPLRLGRRTVSV